MKKFIKKFSTFISKIKVQKQLYLIFFAAIFIPVTLIGGYQVFNTRKLLASHYEEQAYADNLRVRSILLDMTTSVYDKASYLCKDSALKELLEHSYSTREEAFAALEDFSSFEDIQLQDAAIEEIAVYNTNTTLPDYKTLHYADEEIRKNDWYQKMESSAAPFWTAFLGEDKFGNPQVQIALYSKVFLTKTDSFAVLKISLSSNHIKNRLETGTHELTLWLNQDSPIYSSGGSFEDGITIYKGLVSLPYSGMVSLDNKKVFASVSQLDSYYSDDTFYICVVNQEGVAYIQKMTRTYVAVLLLILLVISSFIYLFSRYFGKRVATLRHAMHQASSGNYNIIDTFNGSDELSDAFSDLNLMVRDILKKEAEVYNSKLRAQELINRQQQMEFKMLSSQINPHFLYNTLETIRMRSIKAGNREVANGVKLLGKSMRYVLDNTATASTTLDKELDYIETYLAIQKLRFHDKINYSLKYPLDMDLSTYHILPLLLQPVVENAIIHGLEEVEKDGRIILHIEEKEGVLHIKIFDNGCGMSQEEQSRLLSNMRQKEHDSAKSIGLYNIYQRIRLCYGSQYGITIKSKKLIGTLFELTIPA